MCDTDDWSMTTENSALHQEKQIHFKIYIKNENSYFKLQNIYYIFDQLNAALVSVK